MNDNKTSIIIVGEVCVCFVTIIFIMQQCALEDIKHSGSGKTLYTIGADIVFQ